MKTPTAKMDKSGDVKRGSRKPQQHSSANLISGSNGGVVDSEKAVKEKIRRLSSVNGIQHSKTETGSSCCCDLSSDNRENQCLLHSQNSSLRTKSTTKRFKIPRKISDECIGVDHASVPRKLRSTKKKRCPEAISPHSLDSKKPKLNLKQGGSDGTRKATVSREITKDEEEVVETLYALAGMFPDDDLMEVRSLCQPETAEGPATLLEVQKEDTRSVQAAEIVPLSTINELSNKVCKLDSLNKPSTREQPDLTDNKKLHSEMRSNTDIPSIKNGTDAENTSCTHGDFRVISEPSLEAGLKQPKLQMTNLFERTPEMAFGVSEIESQIAQRNMTREPRKNGLTLWPGLSSTVLRAHQSLSSSQSDANTIPTWLDAANYGPKTCSPEAGSSTEKVLKITRDRNSMKRSTTHVYISRLIHNLQMHDKDGILQQPLWLKPREGLKQADHLRNAINVNVAGSNSGSTATGRNSYEARSAIIPQQKMLQQEPQAASASRMNTSKGQSFDFLSLSAGGFRIDANVNSSEVRNAMESMSQLQVPHLHLHPQHQPSMPFSKSPVDYSSSACLDHLSTATATQQVQLQLPQYLSNPFCGPAYTSNSYAKKQQQRLWEAQYRWPHGTSPVMSQISSRQNGKTESSTSMPCAQTSIFPHPTLDAFGPKYYSVSQYQQPKLACTSSLTPTRVRTDHHFSSVYEESNGGFSTERPLPLPLQLLRNW